MTVVESVVAIRVLRRCAPKDRLGEKLLNITNPLTNAVYVGRVEHRGEVYPGEQVGSLNQKSGKK
jgi:hypothetical protein